MVTRWLLGFGVVFMAFMMIDRPFEVCQVVTRVVVRVSK